MTDHESAWYAQRDASFSGGNEVALLTGGDQLFPAMQQAIARARHDVWLATYIFHDDAAARAMADTLIDAARRGVRVRVVVDGFGSKASLPTLRRWFDGSGVALAVFRPIDRWYAWLQPGQLRRLHQKLLACDTERAFVGGINVIDDRNDLNHGATPEPRLDFAVALRGSVVGPVAQTARAMWTRAAFGRDWRDEVIALARSAEPVARARSLIQRLRVSPGPEPAQAHAGAVRAAFLVRDNLRQRRAIERSYIDALSRARERIDLISPYFYPGRLFRRVLRDAARRGVRVRLLLQGKLDYRFAGLAAQVLYDEMLSRGVQIYEYTPAFLHAKVALADDDWATVGSSNIDPLSLLLNLEANVVVRDAAFTAALAAAFEQAVQVSREVTAPPLAPGWVSALRRGFVAWAANWYLRLAGISGRY
ncbi:MAG: cardiolipin synthase ClsB [Burkholderiaceae bacterium]|nr:cardiolipin synthase ClsB [Burkholderiaceae bacterium]